MNEISLFCWNIGNPSIDRAKLQFQWLINRSDDFFILTEAKNSKGCLFLKNSFENAGYYVVFPKIEGKEYGTLLVSKRPLKVSYFSDYIKSLPFRSASAKVSLDSGVLEIIGIYVPSRDKSPKKVERKKKFLKHITEAINNAPRSKYRIVLGDFNILEPNHNPYYPFFENWEYSFYKNLLKNGLEDAFRSIKPNDKEYSWVGRTGNGYRYDHCFISNNMLTNLKECFYLHNPRSMRLSDHSAIITKLKI